MKFSSPQTEEQQQYFARTAQARFWAGVMLIVFPLVWAVADFFGIFELLIPQYVLLNTIVTFVFVLICHGALLSTALLVGYDKFDNNKVEKKVFALIPIFLSLGMIYFGYLGSQKLIEKHLVYKGEKKDTGSQNQDYDKRYAQIEDKYAKLEKNIQLEQKAKLEQIETSYAKKVRTIKNKRTYDAQDRANQKLSLENALSEKKATISSVNLLIAKDVRANDSLKNVELSPFTASLTKIVTEVTNFNAEEAEKERKSKAEVPQKSKTFTIIIAILFWITVLARTRMDAKSGILPIYTHTDGDKSDKVRETIFVVKEIFGSNYQRFLDRAYQKYAVEHTEIEIKGRSGNGATNNKGGSNGSSGGGNNGGGGTSGGSGGNGGGGGNGSGGGGNNGGGGTSGGLLINSKKTRPTNVPEKVAFTNAHENIKYQLCMVFTVKANVDTAVCMSYFTENDPFLILTWLNNDECNVQFDLDIEEIVKDLQNYAPTPSVLSKKFNDLSGEFKMIYAETIGRNLELPVGKTMRFLIENNPILDPIDENGDFFFSTSLEVQLKKYCGDTTPTNFEKTISALLDDGVAHQPSSAPELEVYNASTPSVLSEEPEIEPENGVPHQTAGVPHPLGTAVVEAPVLLSETENTPENGVPHQKAGVPHQNGENGTNAFDEKIELLRRNIQAYGTSHFEGSKANNETVARHIHRLCDDAVKLLVGKGKVSEQILIKFRRTAIERLDLCEKYQLPYDGRKDLLRVIETKMNKGVQNG